MERRLYAGIDVGTSRVKMVVYDEGFKPVARYTASSPLRIEADTALHDAAELAWLVRFMLEKAIKTGVRAVGLSVYRASISAWKPGGVDAGDVILWLDYGLHAKALRSAGFALRLLQRVPLAGRLASPLSPLPLLVWVSRSNPGLRVWSVDALVAEWVAGVYAADPANASLMGALEPFTGRPLPVYRIAGYIGEPPRLHPHDEPLARREGTFIGPVIADQQAGLLASGCLDGSCVKLDLGTGFFADYPGGLPRPGSLAAPVACLKTSYEYVRCSEAMAPGAGLTLSWAAALTGGYDALAEIARGGCSPRESGIIVPYIPASPVKPWRPRSAIIHSPLSPGRREQACAAIAGLVAAVAANIESLTLIGAPPRVRVFGGASRAEWLLDAAARLSGAELEVYRDVDGSSLGAALLAAMAAGDIDLSWLRGFSPPGENTVYDPQGGGGVLRLWLEVLGGGKSSYYEALPELLEMIESILLR